MTAPVQSDPCRALVKSIGGAVEAITKAEAISDDDAHRSRKALKKARAALRLLRPSIGDVVYRRENAVLRNASRIISPLRDAKAQVDIVVALKERYSQSSRSEVLPFENKLRDKLDRLRGTVNPRAPDVGKTVRILKATRQRLELLGKKAIRPTGIHLGLRKIYRQGRQAFRAAVRGPTSASLHEWRKKTKYFANAVDVLGQSAQSRQVSLRKKADRLGDWLGEDHDLSVLLGAVRRDRTLNAKSNERIQAVIATRRKKLQKKALRLGATLYAKKAKRI